MRKRIISTVLSVMLLFICVCPASAATYENEYLDYIVSTLQYSNGIYTVTTVYTHDDVFYVVPGTRALHEEGATLTIHVGNSESRTESATASLGFSDSLGVGASAGASAGFEYSVNASFTQTITGTVGLAQSETCSVEAGVSYTLGEKKAPGVYCIALVFPGKTVKKQISAVNSKGFEVILWEETIEFAPRADYSYYALKPLE